MHLDRVQGFFEYWQFYPPLRDLVAAFIGFKPTETAAEKSKQYVTADDLKRIMTMTGGKMPGVGQR